MNGRVLGPQGNAHPSMVPHGVYACRGSEEWVAITVRDDADWAALRSVLGATGWAAPHLDSLAGRLAAREALDTRLAASTRQFRAEDLVMRLQKAGVPCGRVHSTRQLAADPHLQARGTFETVDHPDAGTHPYPTAVPFHFARQPLPPTSPAPMFGEHNARVLRDVLGLSDAEIVELEAQGVISDTPEWAKSDSEARLLAAARAAHH